MPARDIFHNVVRNALEKDGWTITDDPLELSYGDRKVFADLGAERPIGAQKADKQIAVEIKSFLGKSDIRELELAIGQYNLYRAILKRTDPNRQVYLAIPRFSYEGVFSEPIGELLVEEQELSIIVFDDQSGGIVKWIQ